MGERETPQAEARLIERAAAEMHAHDRRDHSADDIAQSWSIDETREVYCEFARIAFAILAAQAGGGGERESVEVDRDSPEYREGVSLGRRSAGAFREALRTPTAPVGERTEGWRPISELPPGRPGLRVNIRTATTYRWIPYKKDGVRQTGRLGRWQVATEYGWTNGTLPENGEWILNEPLPPPERDGVDSGDTDHG